MLSGVISNLDNCDAIECWLINARHKTGLYVDSSQVLCGCRKKIKLNEEPNTK
ncbi:hypothetical protein HanPSC8_Chr10g0442361 [Helianthus annuus]|nr:hypothetical protein HanIR_Chr10g0493651 [Helianthus annuus]KAJ0885173.1 hypothetical protein HanPSC8_Chr10g0442361 [Helianthus annuus]